MVQVNFSEEERWRQNAVMKGSGSVGGLTGWFIRHGFARDERQANQVLLIVFLGVILVTAILALIGLEII